MGPVLLGLAVAAAALALPFVTRRLRPGRHPAPAGPPVTPPAGTEARPEAQPRGGITGPFGYDNGVTTGDAP